MISTWQNSDLGALRIIFSDDQFSHDARWALLGTEITYSGWKQLHSLIDASHNASCPTFFDSL